MKQDAVARRCADQGPRTYHSVECQLAASSHPDNPSHVGSFDAATSATPGQTSIQRRRAMSPSKCRASALRATADGTGFATARNRKTCGDTNTVPLSIFTHGRKHALRSFILSMTVTYSVRAFVRRDTEQVGTTTCTCSLAVRKLSIASGLCLELCTSQDCALPQLPTSCSHGTHAKIISQVESNHARAS